MLYRILIEGPDGAGKSTLALALASILHANEVPVIMYKEPGELVEGLRTVAKHPHIWDRELGVYLSKRPSFQVASSLMLASMAATEDDLSQWYRKLSCRNFAVAIYDRGLLSSLVYQVLSGDHTKFTLKESKILAAYEALVDVRYDATFILNASPENMATRKGVSLDDSPYVEDASRISHAYRIAPNVLGLVNYLAWNIGDALGSTKKCRWYFPKIDSIDTDSLTSDQTLENVTRKLIEWEPKFHSLL